MTSFLAKPNIGYVLTVSGEFLKKFVRPLPSHDGSIYSVLNMLWSHELWTARRLNFRTFNVFPVNRAPDCTNFQPVESSSDAIMAEVEWKKRSISTAAAVYDGHDNDTIKK